MSADRPRFEPRRPFSETGPVVSREEVFPKSGYGIPGGVEVIPPRVAERAGLLVDILDDAGKHRGVRSLRGTRVPIMKAGDTEVSIHYQKSGITIEFESEKQTPHRANDLVRQLAALYRDGRGGSLQIILAAAFVLEESLPGSVSRENIRKMAEAGAVALIDYKATDKYPQERVAILPYEDKLVRFVSVIPDGANPDEMLSVKKAREMLAYLDPREASGRTIEEVIRDVHQRQSIRNTILTIEGQVVDCLLTDPSDAQGRQSRFLSEEEADTEQKPREKGGIEAIIRRQKSQKRTEPQVVVGSFLMLPDFLEEDPTIPRRKGMVGTLPERIKVWDIGPALARAFPDTEEDVRISRPLFRRLGRVGNFLRGETTTIYHLGQTVKFLERYSSLPPDDIDGRKALLKEYSDAMLKKARTAKDPESRERFIANTLGLTFALDAAETVGMMDDIDVLESIFISACQKVSDMFRDVDNENDYYVLPDSARKQAYERMPAHAEKVLAYIKKYIDGFDFTYDDLESKPLFPEGWEDQLVEKTDASKPSDPDSLSARLAPFLEEAVSRTVAEHSSISKKK